MCVSIVASVTRSLPWILLTSALTVSLSSNVMANDLVQALMQPDGSAPVAAKPAPSFWKDPVVLESLIGGTADNLSTNAIPYSQPRREINPLLPQNHVGNFAMQAGIDVGKAYLLHKLAQSHPTLAKILGAADFSIGALDTANNLDVASGGPGIPPFKR